MIEIYLAGVALAFGINMTVWGSDDGDIDLFERVSLCFITAATSWFWVGRVIGALCLKEE